MRVVKNPAPFFFRFATTSCHYFSSPVVFIFIYSIGIIFVVVVELLTRVREVVAAIPRCTNLLCQICKVIRFQSSYKTSRKPRPFVLLGFSAGRCTGGMACLLGMWCQQEDFRCTLGWSLWNRDWKPSDCFFRTLVLAWTDLFSMVHICTPCDMYIHTIHKYLYIYIYYRLNCI